MWSKIIWTVSIIALSHKLRSNYNFEFNWSKWSEYERNNTYSLFDELSDCIKIDNDFCGNNHMWSYQFGVHKNSLSFNNYKSWNWCSTFNSPFRCKSNTRVQQQSELQPLIINPTIYQVSWSPEIWWKCSNLKCNISYA